jgi:hypothetical protein
MIEVVQSRMYAAIEAIYRLFASTTPESIEGCPCCTSETKTDVLLITPLRSLSGRQLYDYAADVFLTVGDERDFRYLLPRILDISINDPASANHVEVVVGKLGLAGWSDWSDREKLAIDEFLQAWFELAILRDQTPAREWLRCETEALLCGAARAGLPLRPKLMRLLAPDAAPILADMKARYPAEMSPYWSYAPEAFSELSTILYQGQA